MSKCIDCGSPCVKGSTYCEPCQAPIHKTARELYQEFLEESMP